ncbi:PREDICTED: trissin receptor-like [Branchiostoma belcheri]|uniref:Trissin receptor-like n=1 Tax=Branchiostoma belcheri TaxID=7741 RepID=A0A6P4ZX19_BRABE|nr:PREDICTED: trissin receptor-like [Branchiostoma belcheri]
MGEPDLPSISLWVVTVVYCVIFVVGVSGNMLVGMVVWKNVDMRTPTNFFLVNLSIADLLLLLVTMPVALLETWIPEPWLLGRFMCKSTFITIYHLVFQASILTISAIGVERYYAICHPLTAKRTLTRRRIFCSIVGIWAFSLVLSSPMIAFTNLYSNQTSPNQTNSSVVVEACVTDIGTTLGMTYITAGSVLFLVVPLLLLVGLYTAIRRRLCDLPSTEQGRDVRKLAQMRSRRQVINMLVAVVVTFFVCTTPHKVVQMWLLFLSSEQYEALQQNEVMVMNLLVFLRIMVYLNSTLNPILYTLMSSNFQTGLLIALGCRKKDPCQSTASTYVFSSRRSATAISLATLKSYPSHTFSRSTIRKDFAPRQNVPATPGGGSGGLSPNGGELAGTPASWLVVCAQTSTGSSGSSI